MQLLFRCPQTGQEFRSERWAVQGSMQVVLRNGRKTLEGRVIVECPACGAVHFFDPDELSCPLAPEPPEAQE
jgi:uncharacterized C2H2 Zn-finger protein